MIDSGAYGQVILAYDYLFQTKVLYRYLKASNIFVDLDGHVRIEPFCFARVSKRRGKCTNDSVCIRWYRASELVLCDGTYTSAMDMWSVGCILGELICGQPVFPGRCLPHEHKIFIENHLLSLDLVVADIDEAAFDFLNQLLLMDSYKFQLVHQQFHDKAVIINEQAPMSTKYDANLINKIAISNHAVMISDGFFLHDNNKQPVDMIVQFEPQKTSGNFMFDYYKKKRQEHHHDVFILENPFVQQTFNHSKRIIFRREDKKEKLYKEYQKKIEMINKHNPDDYDKYSTASVDMDLTPLTIDTTTPKEPEKLGVASCITPDLDKVFNLYTKILDPEESDRDGLS
ncbi:unnamed protein product [Rotaria socialis]|uniref:Protein kinase domain-containing protein n=1 Tax=Rotaria socialis TaxID=392032 RepID=A0A820T8Z5_9BILA|nr:unnamed protein product [Rotaria socialis]